MLKVLKLFYIFVFLIHTKNLYSAWDNGGVIAIIQSVTVLQNGTFYIITDKDICDGGEINKVAYVYKEAKPNGIEQTSEGIKMMLSIALTAQATQKKVQLFADDSGSARGCKLGAIKVY